MSAPGWYPDPSDPSRQRYFDGKAWTENYAPFGVPTPGNGQPAKTGMSRGIKIGLGVAAAVIALIALGSIGNSDKTSSSSSSTVTTTRSVGVLPTTTEPPPTVETGFTPAQENAIAKAESYLDYTAFSKQKLIEQLEFSKFSTTDAMFAVEYIEANGGVDWNEQAVKKAESYLDYTAFSKQKLIEQLEFSGFTPSQAQHGASVAYGG